MARTAAIIRTYPKRKRAEISYAESSSGESEAEDDDLSSEEDAASKRKVCQHLSRL